MKWLLNRLTGAFFSSFVYFKHSSAISNTKNALFRGFVKAIFPTRPINTQRKKIKKRNLSNSSKCFWASVWQIPYKSDYKQLSFLFYKNGGKIDKFGGKLWKYGPWSKFNWLQSSFNVILHKLSKYERHMLKTIDFSFSTGPSP